LPSSGTNAVLRSHQEITESFVPRSDLVMFVTSVDRPFTESERSFCSRVLEWRKKLIIVINKFDALDNDQDKQTVLDFVRFVCDLFVNTPIPLLSSFLHFTRRQQIHGRFLQP
jgi:predicted GTPase